MLDQYGGIINRPTRNPFGGVGGDPNEIDNVATPSNPGKWARVGGNPDDTTKPYLFDANGNHVIVPYGGGGAGAAPTGGGGGGGGAATTTGTTAGTVTKTAGILGSSLTWSDVINAALAIYSLHKSDQTPNFYQPPETPAEKFRNDQTKNLYGFASGYTEQYLKGLGDLNPNFQMPNNLTGNPAFMGGVKVPVIDYSKVPSINGAPTSAPAATPPSSSPQASIPIDPSRVKVDPVTGKLTMANATPQEQAMIDSLNAVIAGNGSVGP